MNSIRRLPNSSSTINTSWAIRAKASQSTLYGIKVNNVWGEFRVHQCDNGILIDGGYYSEIEKGKFFNIAHTAIKQQNTMPWPTWNNTTSQIQINNNQIQMVTVGVDLYNNGNTLTEVKENTIQNTAYRDRSVAIRAQNLLLKPSKCKFSPDGFLNIENNYTFRFETGIQADLCNCLKVSDNDVVLNNPNWDQAHGIWVRSSLGALIDNNNVYGSGMQWYSQGIRLEFSPQTTLSCNYVTNTENALWIHNNNIFSTVIGNTFQQYKNGLHLTYNGLIGSQLISGTDKYDLFNSFTNNGSYDNDLYTSWNTYGSNSQYCSFTALNSEKDYTSTVIPILDANNNSFSGYCRINNRYFNGYSFIFTGPYANENRWINKWKHKQFFKSMGDSIFQLFPNINYIYQLEDSIELTEINKFILADSLMVNKQWNDADLLLQQINSTELIEEYWKNTNQIMLNYLPVFLLGNDTTVSLTDHISLLNIANSCPYQLGDIVTKARIFVTRHINPLEVFSDNCITGTNYIPRLSNGAESLVTSIVYPNPGEDELYVKLNGDENVDLILYDLYGRIVFSEQNYQSETLIFTKDFKPGCYYIVLRNNEVHEVFPWIKK